MKETRTNGTPTALWLSILTVLMPLVSAAQTHELQAGMEVRVPGSLRGTVLDVRGSSLLIGVPGGEGVLEVNGDTALKLEMLIPRRHLAYRTTRWGAAAGAIAGLLGGLLIAEGQCFGVSNGCRPIGAIGGTTMGLIGGFGVGAAVGIIFHRDNWEPVSLGPSPPAAPVTTLGLSVRF